MSLAIPARIQISPQVIFQELDGEEVLLDLATERYYGLNDVGARMWQLLAESGDTAAVRARMLEEYAVPAETLERDLSALILRLLDAGLIRVEAKTEGSHTGT